VANHARQVIVDRVLLDLEFVRRVRQVPDPAQITAAMEK
jgi:hypothetical protein